MADELVAMWRASYDRALAPYRDPHTLREQKQYLLKVLSRESKITVARAGRELIGFMAQRDAEIGQLYLHVDHQGAGLGRRFIALAREHSPRYLHLHTFQRNVKARRFYLREGFTEIGFGYRNMEGLADVELEWRIVTRVRAGS
jgi:GNAT superfamily N-acetyltransferase